MSSDDEGPRGRETGPRSIGQLLRLDSDSFNESRTYPVSTLRTSSALWRSRLIRETERALKKAILRRDWHRAGVLFLGCCRRAFRNTMTFRQSSTEVDDNHSLTTERDLLQITHFFEGGAEIRDAIVERRISEKDYLRCHTRSFYFVFERIVELLTKGRTIEALECIQSALRQWKYRMTSSRPSGMMLRMLTRYSSWTVLQKSTLDHLSSRTGRLWSAGSQEASIEAKEAGLKAIGDFSKKMNVLNGGICAQFIRCELLCWFNEQSSAMEVAKNNSEASPFHTDARLLNLVMIVGQSSPLNQPVSILEALLRFLEWNPNDEGVARVLEAVEGLQGGDLTLQVECVRSLISILNSCHPEHHPLAYCIQHWTKFLHLMEPEGQETMPHEGLVSRDQILSLVQSRLPWWRRYYFSMFALRNWSKQMSLDEEKQSFLCVIAQVSCHLFGNDTDFCRHVILPLDEKWRLKIQNTKSKISDL